ncbi:MAG: anti-sigma factor [Flavobacteriales bacterium]|nr:anti-sigma factor [Flavobacteriales bacterium]
MTNEENIFLDSGLLEQYTLDLCSDVERREVEQMLASSDLVREEYERIQEGMEILAKSRALTPPSGTKEGILARLEEEKTPVIPIDGTTVANSGGPLLWKLVAGIALLIALGLLFKQSNDLSELRAELEGLKSENLAQSETNDALRKSYELMSAEYAFTKDPQTSKVVLTESEVYDDLQLVAYWNEDAEKAILDVSAMPKAPEGKCFQLWADVHGEMISVAVISSESSDFQEGAFHADAESLNITLEDFPGSDHATVTALVTNAEV